MPPSSLRSCKMHLVSFWHSYVINTLGSNRISDTTWNRQVRREFGLSTTPSNGLHTAAIVRFAALTPRQLPRPPGAPFVPLHSGRGVCGSGGVGSTHRHQSVTSLPRTVSPHTISSPPSPPDVVPSLLVLTVPTRPVPLVSPRLSLHPFAPTHRPRSSILSLVVPVSAPPHTGDPSLVVRLDVGAASVPQTFTLWTRGVCRTSDVRSVTSRFER
jgi:hypothetical protein